MADEQGIPEKVAPAEIIPPGQIQTEFKEGLPNQLASQRGQLDALTRLGMQKLVELVSQPALTANDFHEAPIPLRKRIGLGLQGFAPGGPQLVQQVLARRKQAPQDAADRANAARNRRIGQISTVTQLLRAQSQQALDRQRALRDMALKASQERRARAKLRLEQEKGAASIGAQNAAADFSRARQTELEGRVSPEEQLEAARTKGAALIEQLESPDGILSVARQQMETMGNPIARAQTERNIAGALMASGVLSAALQSGDPAAIDDAMKMVGEGMEPFIGEVKAPKGTELPIGQQKMLIESTTKLQKYVTARTFFGEMRKEMNAVGFAGNAAMPAGLRDRIFTKTQALINRMSAQTRKEIFGARLEGNEETLANTFLGFIETGRWSLDQIEDILITQGVTAGDEFTSHYGVTRDTYPDALRAFNSGIGLIRDNQAFFPHFEYSFDAVNRGLPPGARPAGSTIGPNGENLPCFYVRDEDTDRLLKYCTNAPDPDGTN